MNMVITRIEWRIINVGTVGDPDALMSDGFAEAFILDPLRFSFVLPRELAFSIAKLVSDAALVELRKAQVA